jgi:hypothetical protein
MGTRQKPSPVHQALTQAIAEAQRRGEEAKADVDAFLAAKRLLLQRQGSAAQETSDGGSEPD